MGQKTNPISNRIGITRGWDSNWVGGNYAEKIAEDYEIRKYLGSRLAKASLSRIIIERTLKLITVTIHAARPGVIIGKGGQEVDKLKEELKKVTNKDVQINIFEVKRPEVDATIVADSIARQIEGRVSRGRRGHQGPDQRPRGRRRNRPLRDVQGRPHPAAYLPCRHRLRPGRGQHPDGYHGYQGLDLQR